MRLRWTYRARQDLLEIGRFSARDSRNAARDWTGRLRSRARTAAEMPYSGRVVPEFQREDIRELLLRNYRIVYRIREVAVDVLTVFEGHRRFPNGIDLDST